ncbi:MAG TPA: hypothetical protein VG650_15285 [Mycobacteriales bacterium]|nr:hypothetical protein [Mycobacteriales bacterium]
MSRPLLPRESRVAIACGGAGALAGLASMFASQDGSLHPSALVHLAQSDQLAPLAVHADPHFHLVTPVEHYDGVYYYAIARDPFLTGTAHKLIDQPAYRYGHPLNGWLAGLLSFGQARAVPLALLLLSLIGLGVAGWAASRLAVHLGCTPWGGLLIAASPGLLFAAASDTTEPVGAALVALSLLAWVRGRFAVAAALITLACLDKEQYITVPLGLVVWELVQWRRTHTSPERLPVKLLAVAIGPVVLADWYVYVHGRIGTWPFHYQSGNLGAPFVGWRDAFRISHALAGGSFEQSQIGSVTPAVLTATATLIIVGVVAARRIVTVIDAPAIGMAIITSMQGWRTLVYPHEIFRTPAIAVLLATAVLLTRRPRAVAFAEPPIAGS